MAHRNRQDDYRNRDWDESRQEEQYQDTSGHQQMDYNQDGWSEDDQWDDTPRGPTDFYYEEVVLVPRRNRSRADNQGQTQYSRDDYGARAAYSTRPQRQSQPGTHGNFRGDSYGGEPMAGPSPSIGSRTFYDQPHGYAATGASYSGGYAEERNRPERGFFDRAGDEIASWFGDEEAARRRRMDHRGRGPANYTRSNERLLEDACECLMHDRGVDASNITVTCDNNEITLDGTVTTRWEKRRAEDLVHDISGVKHVQNNLRIEQTEMRAGTPKTEKS